MYSRRSFLKLTGLLGLLPVALKAQNNNNDNDQKAKAIIFGKERIAVVQGTTDAQSTLISILAHKEANPTIKVLDPQLQEMNFQVQRIDLNLGDFVIFQIFVDQLELGKEYALMLADALYPDTYIRYFKSLDLQNPQVKVAVLSCASHREIGPKATMFRKLFQSKPDVIFFHGDLVYANSNLDTYLGRAAKAIDGYKIYIKTLMEFEIYNRQNLIPIFSTWDDHDLGYNNADTTTPEKDLYLKIFRAFFPADSRVKAITQGPGVSYVFEAFGLQIFFFDARYYKQKKKQKFLGDEQFLWMTEQALKSSLPKMFILSQQLLYYSFIAESYERQAQAEFNNFMSFFKQQKVPVVFITGDVHYSQIQELGPQFLGYKTYEITSSAFFSLSAGRVGKRSESEGQLAHYGYPNFVLIDQIKANSTQIELSVNCVSEASDAQFTKNLQINR